MAGLSSLDFEGHASFCKVSVDEALIVKQMLADGHSMREIRTAIDGRFGDLLRAPPPSFAGLRSIP